MAFRRVRWMVGASLALGIFACVGDPTSVGTAPDDDDGGGTGDDASSPTDGGSSGSDGASTGDAGNGDAASCVAPLSACGATCVDLQGDDANCGACGHSCGGDGCDKGTCKPFALLTGLNFPTEIAANDAIDQVVVNTNSKIFRCAKTGCGNVPVPGWSAATPITRTTSPVAIGRGPGGTQEFSTIVYANSSSNAQLVVMLEIVPTTPITTPSSYAAVDTIKHLAGDPGPSSSPIAGQADYGVYGSSTTGLLTTSGTTKYVGEDGEGTIAIQSGSPGYLLWPSYSTIRSCKRGSADAGPCSPASLFTSSVTDTDAAVGTPEPLLAVSSTTAYWVSRTAQNAYEILSCPFPGGCSKPKVVVTGITAIDRFAGDDKGVYWTDSAGGKVLACTTLATGCAAPTPIVVNLSQPVGIAIDQTHVFVAVSGIAAGQGKVLRIVR